MVTAHGSDFTAILLRVLVNGAPGGSAQFAFLNHHLRLLSSFLPRLFPLAVVDADFMINMLFGFGSGSIGLSLGPDAAGADDSASVTSAADLSLLLFFWHFFGQFVYHFCSSIHSLCTMWSGSESLPNSHSATI